MRQGILFLLFFIFPSVIACSAYAEKATVSSVQEPEKIQSSVVAVEVSNPHIASTPPQKESTLLASPENKKDKRSIINIDHTLFEENSHLQKVNDDITDQKRKVSNQESNLDRLSTQAKLLAKNLNKEKINLKKAYNKVLTIPNFKIDKYQSAYQKAWSDVKQNQQSRFELTQMMGEENDKLHQLKTTASMINSKIENLEKDKQLARATRLYSELRKQREEKISFTNRCSPKMTLRECENQTVELALQKAVKQFKTLLIKDATESETIKKRSDNISFKIHVLKYNILSSGFQNKNRYRVVLEGLLQSKLSKTTTCQLLNVGKQYCLEHQIKKHHREIAWYNVTVHSNQYDDTVYIDGVHYGKSPVDISLPRGIHVLTVKKEGYVTYQQPFKLTSDITTRAILKQKGNPLKTGFKFKDTLNKDQTAPEVITIAPGVFYIGEYNSIQYKLDHAFAIAATPTTVNQFKHFVASTGYKTDAEFTKNCLIMKESQAKPNKEANWKHPLFKQTSNNPVVCVTKSDALAYTKWLSKQTGFTYRLPTQEEWEIASRGGKATDYWWGNEFKVGGANTGWGGTYWSNKSTSPVRSFTPNPLGLYDMIGNVWEWTNSVQGITRGGSWCFSPLTATAHSQFYVAPSTAANYIGFRVLREIH